jgi:NADPH2:quinone reductase
MKTILCESFGPATGLVLRDVPAPSPGPGEVLVEVSYAALNFFDTLLIANKYQIKPKLPFSPGAEFAGTIRSLGQGAEAPIGARVVGFIGHGACQAAIVCQPAQLTIIPDGVPDRLAAGLAVTYGTALHALRQRAQLVPGETLAVLGAAGGTGLAAVEIGRLLGARTIACCSSPAKLAFATRAGAAEGIDYTQDNLRDRLKALTADRGVDVVFDTIGGPFSEAALRAIAWHGRFLVVGFASGEVAKMPLNMVLLKGCDVRGVFWGEFVARQPSQHAANMTEILAWAQAGAISGHVHAALPPEAIAEAFHLIESRQVQGKVLIEF